MKFKYKLNYKSLIASHIVKLILKFKEFYYRN